MIVIMKSAMILTWDVSQMTAEVICSPGHFVKKITLNLGIDKLS